MDRSTNVVAMGEHDNSEHGAFADFLGFVWHFVQMVFVMAVGMGVYHLLYAVLDVPLGISAALRPYPAVRQFMMDVSMAVPMVLFMWYMGSGWRRNMEMAFGMMAGPVVFLACLQLGLHQNVPGLSAKGLQAAAEISMYVGMLAVMLYRRNEHVHGHGARLHAAHEHAGSLEARPAMHGARGVHESH